MTGSNAHRVVIAGAGVAGLEALIGLHALAADRVEISLLSPDEEFLFQAQTVEAPFARPSARCWSLAEMCAAHGATHVRDRLASVDATTQRLTTGSGEEIEFDSLLVAVGAKRERVLEGRATIFGGDRDAEAVHGLVQDVEGGYVKSIAFVVPSGVTWPLPLYELALMTAERAYEMSCEVRMAFVTPEELPLGVFGRVASDAVAGALEKAGIEFVGATYPRRLVGGSLLLAPSGELRPFDRVVSVPRLAGPGIAGLPVDENGFIAVDNSCQVRGSAGVFAAGDGTTFPIKQGGLAAQQADTAAMAIAQRAGADVEPRPFEPVLRAKLLTGSRAHYLRQALGKDGGEATSTASDHTLWWPPSKVAAPHLAAYLAAREAGVEPPHVGSSPPVAMHAMGDPAGGIDLLEH